MAIPSTTNQVTYNTDGINDTFSFPYKFLASADLKVDQVDISTGTITRLVLNSDYTVTGAGSESGGDVITTTVLALGSKIVITRQDEATQAANYSVGGDLDKDALQNDFDKMVILVQQMINTFVGLVPADTVKGPILLPIFEAGKFLQINSAGDGFVLADSSTTSDARVNSLFNSGNSDSIYPLDIYLPNGVRILEGTGSPEGSVTGPVGSIYLRSDGAAGTSTYFKETGSGVTGWVTRDTISDLSNATHTHEDAANGGDSLSPASLAVDAISEQTPGAGVTADSVLLKDGNVDTAGLKECTVPDVAGTPVDDTLYSQSMVKGWVVVTGTTAAITSSYNVSGVVRDGVGLYTVSWDKDFASAAYVCVATTDRGAAAGEVATITAQVAGSVQIIIQSAGGVTQDPEFLHVMAIGEQ
jgi:hypothetical protein